MCELRTGVVQGTGAAADRVKTDQFVCLSFAMDVLRENRAVCI